MNYFTSRCQNVLYTNFRTW